MADLVTLNGDHLNALLKPFHQRASEAEERLSKLEATLLTKQGGNPDAGSSELVRELQSKLEQATTELASEQQKVAELRSENAKLATENAKKDYRISHLVRLVRELDPQSK